METELRTLGAEWYCDPLIYQRERRAIFAREWLYACHTRELPEPGSYLAVEIGGYPILILRDREGEVRAFHNVCRHRAAPLVNDGCGHFDSKLMTCRYHGWSYDMQGNLAGAPLFDSLKECTRSELSLYPVRIAIHRGLIFVNMSEQADPFLKTFEQLTSTMDSADCPLESYDFHSKLIREGNFNWKVWVDGFQECYHCMTIHPIFNKDFALQKYKVENCERFSIHSCERRANSQSGAFNGLWLWIFPNLGLPCYEPCFYTLRVNPLAVNRTRLEYTFHFRENIETTKISEFRNFVDEITSEDINICESVQKNLEAGIYKFGILNPERENGVAYFHSLVKNAVERLDAEGVAAGGTDTAPAAMACTAR
jgi:phenylpropionate dioxygenase-like ring-hydroxylating dioxygenase large terminal subunit